MTIFSNITVVHISVTAKIIDAMEERGYVSKPDGNKPRRVLITMDEYMRRKMNNELDDVADEEL